MVQEAVKDEQDLKQCLVGSAPQSKSSMRQHGLPAKLNKAPYDSGMFNVDPMAML